MRLTNQNGAPSITVQEIKSWNELGKYTDNVLVIAIPSVAGLWVTEEVGSLTRVGYIRDSLMSNATKQDYERIFVVSGTETLSDNVKKGMEFAPERFVRGNPGDGDQRTVYKYVGDRQKLGFYMGITGHVVGGSWSSSQLHNFELAQIMSPLLDPFPNFKEYFAFLTNPSGMWGLQVYGQNSPGNIRVIQDGDIVDVPIGPHAVVAGPGTKLAYIWVYTGAWSKEL